MMQDQWEESQFVSEWARFVNPGDAVIGVVVEYSPFAGTTDFNGKECGLLVLEDAESGQMIMVTLDKRPLQEAVRGCRPEPGKTMRVEFSEWVTSKSGRDYKKFRAWWHTRPEQQPPQSQQQAAPPPQQPQQPTPGGWQPTAPQQPQQPTPGGWQPIASRDPQPQPPPPPPPPPQPIPTTNPQPPWVTGDGGAPF